MDFRFFYLSLYQFFMKRYLIILIVLAFCGRASAEGGLIRFVKKVGTFIDSMAVSGVDHRYIESPAKPWQIILQGNMNQSNLKMKSVLDGKALFDETWGDINWEPRIKTDIATYMGVWAGYRGYGFGYSRNIGGDKGSIFKLGAVGSSYGVNLRIHKFQTDEPSVHLSGYMPQWEEDDDTYPLFDPIKVKLLTLDAYYFFNRKQFSYAAAYDQSVIQKRSAGSLMAGAMYYHSSMAYDEGLNADFIMFMNDIGKIKQYQVSLGGGYAYNLVPCKGLMISAMGMMLLTVYNRLDVWRYNSNLREIQKLIRQNPDIMDDDDDVDIDDMDDDEMEELIRENFSIWPMEDQPKVTHHSRVIPVIDARLSVTYNFGNWFVNANAQLNRFSYKYYNDKGNLTDWYINASIGVRL